MTTLIYPVVGILQQSQAKLISEIISQFNEESERVNLSGVRGCERDFGSMSAEGSSLHDSGMLSRIDRYRAEYETLLRRSLGGIAADGHRKSNHTEALMLDSQTKLEERIQGRLSTSSSMMSINSNSFGSLEDLHIDNSSSF